MKLVADTINNVPLNNTALGWVLRPTSEPYTGLEREVIAARTAGIDGVEALVATRGPAYITLEVTTPEKNLEALNALFARPTLNVFASGTPGRVAFGALVTSAAARFYRGGAYITMRYIIQIHEGAWRSSPVEETGPWAIDAATVVVDDVFPGLSAPVQDAVLRFKGAINNLRVTDSSGAWFTYGGPSWPFDEYLRFDSMSGRAFITDSDTWSGGREVSGDIDFGGPRGVFEITPTFTNPANRAGELTIASVARAASPNLRIRGRAAYLV